MKRSHLSGQLNRNLTGQEVRLSGWVNRRRDLGGLIFIDIRDHSGIVQTVIEPGNEEAFPVASRCRSEFVVHIRGTVRERPADQQRGDGTGAVEVLVSELEVLSEARTPPFQVDGSIDGSEVSEELRLRHRYLDLRRPEAAAPIRLRHTVTKAIWDLLDGEGFTQVETPLLTLSTPEGARDFIVPARLRPGSFYALPQSPQLFKQLLMVGGFDRYFQIARCFRDEDLRADRQPDFTQLDLEMSFVDQEDILALNERLLRHVIHTATGRETTVPFRRIPWREALDRYGSDKPDTRFGLELQDVTEVFRDSAFRAFSRAIADGAVTRMVHVPGELAEGLSRRRLDELEETAKQHGAGGLAWLRRTADGFSGPIAKFLEQEKDQPALAAAAEGDVLLFVTAPWRTACTALGAVRLDLAAAAGLKNPAALEILWVTDFPLFEETDDGSLTYMHHPFTMPHEDDLPLLDEDPARVRARAYDLVWNGNEIGGGSIRIHRPEVQEKVFRVLGFSEAEAKERFGFFLDALAYGTTPHGGVAWGLDRLIMLLAGTGSIRDTIAFPKLQSGIDPLTGAPGPADPDQLAELGLTGGD
ncbi:MAG TPA: aspartate--tRNA ligase [Deinococcales bacterium]|nr:aspartate--tRNA ligase [Deinococcales bacterium]